jgi:iduronate 2-sulfatase
VIERRYRALAQVTDREIGRLIEGLEARGLYERTIVVLFSDHGESLGEDSRLPDRHGLFVYNALTHIPFAIRVPQLNGTSSTYPVSLIDLMPTLCELTNTPLPPKTDGMSVLPHLVPDAPTELLDADRVLVVHDSEQWGVVQWPHKLMVRPADNLIELYDLATDFAETTNLAGEMPQRVRELKQHYASFPRVSFDRTRKGRQWRERQAKRPKVPDPG